MRRLLLSVACLLLGGEAVAADAAPPLLLAHVYQDDVALADYWVSEKYDGIRAYWNGRDLVTRNGNGIRAPDWFTAGLPDVVLDGELWIGRGEFELVSATVRDAIPDESAWRRVRFMVFDLPAHSGSFDERLGALQQLHLSGPVQVVPQFRVSDPAALEQQLREVVAAGGEGLMLHRGNSRYQSGRSSDLLKLKPLQDAEARVVGYVPGKGKYVDMLGALQVERQDGVRLLLGTGFTDEERRHPPPIGSWVTYSFTGTTARGLPRFARFVRIRNDMPPVGN